MSIPEFVQQAIAQAFGRQATSLTVRLRKPLAIQSNRLFDVQGNGLHYIAKQYLQPGEMDAAPAREYRALQVLAPLDIAPRLVYYEPATGPLVIYEYMPGEMWDRRPVTSGDLSRLLQVWLKINAAPADWLARNTERSLQSFAIEFRSQFENYLAWARREYAPAARAAELCLELLDRRRSVVEELSEHKPLVCFCKSDPRFANIITRPDSRLGLVDWEDSGLRDPSRDIADLLTHPNQEDLLSWEAWQGAFVRPYLEVRSRLDGDLAARLHLYLALFPILWLSVIIGRGLRLADAEPAADQEINGLPRNGRLRRYLARALAWPDTDFSRKLERLSALEFFPQG
jgi:hypothetical protein